MYLIHFGLNQAPFGITPNPAFFYAGSRRGEILDALLYAVEHGEGIIKVTGEVGSGKTMLCRMLESMLPSRIEVIYLVNPTLGREEVVFAIAGELGLDIDGKRPDEAIRLLQADLIAKHVAGKQVVLLVEEAQAMPLETLEEIRLFSNLETAQHKLLQIVLFGQPELDENLALPRMRQLRERITHSFKVPPLAPANVPEYLAYRMRAAGYRGPDVFSKSAVRRIAKVSEGVVRRISILADKALLAAFADDSHAVLPKHVDAAVRDSEFSRSAIDRRWLAWAAGTLTAIVLAATGWWLSHPQASVPPLAAAASAPPQAPRPAETRAPQAAATVAPPVAWHRPAPEKVPAAPDGEKLLQARLNATASWLDTADPARFSIQLALMNADRAQVERFLRKAAADLGTERLYVYPTRLGGSERYGITYGDFATRAETLAAIEQLTARWGYRPQLRTAGGLKTEIDRARSTLPSAS